MAPLCHSPAAFSMSTCIMLACSHTTSSCSSLCMATISLLAAPPSAPVQSTPLMLFRPHRPLPHTPQPMMWCPLPHSPHLQKCRVQTLAEIADHRRPSALEHGSYALKPCAWAAFDPLCSTLRPHLRPSALDRARQAGAFTQPYLEESDHTL